MDKNNVTVVFNNFTMIVLIKLKTMVMYRFIKCAMANTIYQEKSVRSPFNK